MHAVTLPWLLQSQWNELYLRFCPKCPAPKANGVHHNKGLHRKNSSWTNGARLFYDSRRKDALASLQPARLLWRPALSWHLPLAAWQRWSGGADGPRTLTALFKRQFPAYFLMFLPQPWEGKHLFSVLFQHSRSFPFLSLLWPGTAGGKLLPWISLSSCAGWSDSTWKSIRRFWDPKATGTEN